MEREALDPGRLRRALEGSMWTRLDVVERTQSTNSDVAEAAQSGAPEGLVVAAEHQVAGRGRLGRVWQAPARSGLAVTVLLRPVEIAATRWPWLPLLTGVAVRDALARGADVPARVKWPNDVLVEERKVAGILVERVETPVGPAAVVGMGVNVSLDADDIPVPEATSLLLSGGGLVDRTTLLVEILIALETEYGSWRRAGGEAAAGLRTAYLSACDTLGRRVRVSLPDGTVVVGTATGIDAAGQLSVDVGGATRRYGAGDVVHLRDGS